MATVQDLVADSLTEIGVLGAGETLGAEDGASGLRALNRMVNAWKAERVYLYGLNRATWAIVSGTGTYTVGTGGAVNIARPQVIEAIKYYDTTVTPINETLLRLMTDQDAVAISTPLQQATYPTAAYYELAYPLASIEFWPVPTSTTLMGVLYYPGLISEFAALATAVTLAPGYERLIVKNLALEMAPQYGAEPSQALQRQAQDSMAVVLRSNRRLQEIRFSPDVGMGRGAYDINTDSP